MTIYNKKDIPEDLLEYFEPAEIGLEETPEIYVEKLVEVFREVRRVLRDDGTLWLNLGDSYNGSGKGAWDKTDVQKEVYVPPSGTAATKVAGLKPKDLIGIPWRVAFALQQDGWYLRQDLIWHKPNPMPESVRDRCTKAHEYIFLLSKSAKYYYDHEAIKEPVATGTKSRLSQVVSNQRGSDRVPGKTNGTMKAVGSSETRNKRSVWTVTTKPYKAAHFATFPEALITDCILAGAPIGGAVLDPFIGSGTTGKVCERFGRDWVGIELSKDYCEIAKKRIGAQAIIRSLPGMLI